MKTINALIILSTLLLGMFLTSCSEDEPCKDVVCPTGYLCDNGACAIDPNSDPCATVICDEGFTCVNGDCVEQNFSTIVPPALLSGDIIWTSENVYELAGKVVVQEGSSLTIEAGTIIKGRAGAGSLASALIVARGAQIFANGTETAPIIFTSTADNIEPGESDGGNLSEFDNETWGGLIVLGDAPISADLSDTESQIEGIPADEEYGRYGGNNADDNSGVLTYVSIRHGGALIGEGNEINGITLGGVGAGTVINNIEVAGTLDDGIEFFGGTVNVENAIVSYQGDDGIDIDMNYSGTVNNFAVIHGGDDTDEALEIDGPEGSTYTDGKFTLSNGTLIATDQIKTTGADLKSKAQGTISNCSWEGYSLLIKVRSSFDPDNGCASKSDAYTNLISGDLVVSDCEVVGSFSASDVGRVYSDDDPGEEDCFASVQSNYESNVDAGIANGNNTVVTTATKGADMSVFDGWTLASQRGWY